MWLVSIYGLGAEEDQKWKEEASKKRHTEIRLHSIEQVTVKFSNCLLCLFAKILHQIMKWILLVSCELELTEQPSSYSKFRETPNYISASIRQKNHRLSFLIC
mmetsp:Transcript_59635/g.158724  ORF Transcript_59635/g.158724 Transcript_59635/m.158724 type:complete len:103 (+) Transcript_59635:813-1121(+)